VPKLPAGCRRLKCKSRRNSGGSQGSSTSGSLHQDGGDDQELAGKGDDARHSGFDDAHLNFLSTGSRFAPATHLATVMSNLNCKGRHKQLRFLHSRGSGRRPKK
jgi:hypothetical protein